MPLEINDDTLKELNSLSDDDFGNLYGSLSFDEQQDLWKAVNLAPAIRPTNPLPRVKRESDPIIAPPVSTPSAPFNMQEEMGRKARATKQGGPPASGAIDYAIDAAQKNIGRPVLEAVFQPPGENPFTAEMGPVAEHFTRIGTRFIGGKEWEEGAAPERRAQAQRSVEEFVEPPVAALTNPFYAEEEGNREARELIEGMAREAYTIPVSFGGAGKGAQLATRMAGRVAPRIAPALGRVAGEAVESALISGATAPLTDQSVGDAALAGGAGGGLLRGVGELLSPLARAGKRAVSVPFEKQRAVKDFAAGPLENAPLLPPAHVGPQVAGAPALSAAVPSQAISVAPSSAPAPTRTTPPPLPTRNKTPRPTTPADAGLVPTKTAGPDELLVLKDGQRPIAVLQVRDEGLTMAQRIDAALSMEGRSLDDDLPVAELVSLQKGETPTDGIVRNMVENGEASVRSDGVIEANGPGHYLKLKDLGLVEEGAPKVRGQKEVTTEMAGAAGGGNVRPPAPPQPAPPGTPPPSPSSAMSTQAKLAGELYRANRKTMYRTKALSKLRRLGAHHHVVLPEMAGSLIRLRGARHTQAMRKKVLDELNTALHGRSSGADMESLLRRDVDDLARGKTGFTEMSAKWGNDPDWLRARHIVADTMDQIRSNMQELASRGMLDADDVTAQLTGKTEVKVARTYKRFVLGEAEWNRTMPSDLIERTAEKIAKEQKASGKPIDVNRIVHRIGEILHLPDEAVEGAITQEFSAAAKHLKARKELPDWARELLGEIKDGPWAMAETLAAQRSMLGRARALDRALEEGLASGRVSPNPDPARRLTYEIPSAATDATAPRRFGALQGYFADPEVARALGHINEGLVRMEKGNEALEAMNAMQKLWRFGVTVGGKGGMFMLMFFQSMWSSALAGAGQFYKPTNVKFFNTLMKSYAGMPLDSVEKQMIALAEEMDIKAPSFGELYVSTQDTKFIRQMAKAAATNSHATPMDKILGATSRFWKTGIYAKDAAMSFMDLTLDQGWRVVAFWDRYQHLLDKGLSMDDAADQAAILIKRRFSDMGNPGRLTEMLQPVSGPFNPFINPLVDAMRINALAVTDAASGLVKGEVRDAAHLAKAAATLTGLVYGGSALSTAMGLSPQEQQRLQATRSEAKQRYGPFTMVIPIPDKETGNFPLINFTNYLDFLRLFAGDPNAHPAMRFIANLGMSPVQGGWLEKPIGNAIQNLTGLPTAPQEFKPRPMPGQPQVGQSLRDVGLQSTGVGAMASDFMRTKTGQEFVNSPVGKKIREAGGQEALNMRPNGPADEELSTRDFLLKRIPSVEMVGPNTETAKKMSLKSKASQLRSEYARFKTMRPTETQVERFRQYIQEEAKKLGVTVEAILGGGDEP